MCFCRSDQAQTIFVNATAPRAIREALRQQSWEKASFDVKSLIGKTQVVWVYDAVCKLSGATVALKCYRKELQSAINYQCAARSCTHQLNVLNSLAWLRQMSPSKGTPLLPAALSARLSLRDSTSCVVDAADTPPRNPLMAAILLLLASVLSGPARCIPE